MSDLLKQLKDIAYDKTNEISRNAFHTRGYGNGRKRARDAGYDDNTARIFGSEIAAQALEYWVAAGR